MWFLEKSHRNCATHFFCTKIFVYHYCCWHRFFASGSKMTTMQSQTFELRVDGIPIMVKATPYSFNTETRFLVSYNGSDEYVFTWDWALGRLTAIGDGSANIPDTVEEAIAEKLQSSVS
jgi:hypothetical protein